MKNLFLTLLLMLGLVPMAWAQDEFGATALRLGGSFGEQAEAVEKLGLSGDPRALPLLQALADGKLTRMPDGALRIGEADALTGAPANAAGTSAVRINNRVRAALRIALGRLQIVSPDPAERLRAADGILRSRSAQDLPLLDAALARESVPRIRDRLVLAQGAARLASGDEALKRAGIESLGASGSESARTVLLEARAGNTALTDAIDAAVARIDRQLAFRRAGELLFQGLSLGSVLLLAALGLAVTFGVMGVINMAHGEFVMLGAYTTFMVQEALRGTPLAPWALHIWQDQGSARRLWRGSAARPFEREYIYI